MPDQNDEIVRHLPYVRRYARALLGSQERGDRYVRVCLETLLAEPERANDLVKSVSPRLSLFGLFHEVHDRVGEAIGLRGDEAGPSDPLERGVQGLPPQQRQMLLLTALEGFSVEDSAQILGIDEAEALDLLHTARRELNAQSSADVLIIEDEPIIAMDIADTVRAMGHTVVGVAATKDEAVRIARAQRPGIVMADIKLSDGSSGVEAVQEILKSMDVPVVFVTAYPERLLTGEGAEPTYLVTKPFESDVLKVTIHQALLSHHQPDVVDAAS